MNYFTLHINYLLTKALLQSVPVHFNIAAIHYRLQTISTIFVSISVSQPATPPRYYLHGTDIALNFLWPHCPTKRSRLESWCYQTFWINECVSLKIGCCEMHCASWIKFVANKVYNLKVVNNDKLMKAVL